MRRGWGSTKTRAGRAAILLVLAACGREPPGSLPTLRVKAATPAAIDIPVTIPHPATGPLAPSLVHTPDAGFGARLADVDACATCHADVAATWRKSAHAFASFNNPIYRVAIDRLRADRGDATSQFCGGCHDPSLLVDGLMLGSAVEIASDARAHAGVTCATCHSIAEARPDGNASYDLDPSPIPVPVPGDPDSRLRHRARIGRATLRTTAMCGTCHKAFLDPTTGNASALVGQDDMTPWARSPFAGTESARIDEDIPQKDCRGCHMPRVPATEGDLGAKSGTVASHAFLGSHTWLAAMEGDAALLAETRAFMTGRVSLDIGGTRPGREVGEGTTIDVVVRNLDVGHRFPGGVLDAADTWIELVVEDAGGRVVADAGMGEASTGSDPTAHVLTSYMARADGTRVLARETHDFRAGVWNHTIAPRDAAVVGFSFVAPPSAARPLRARATLRHRTRSLPLQKAACALSRSERGLLDACKAQPITELARAETTLDQPREPTFERSIAYGLGLSHALSEHLDDARAPYTVALGLAKDARQRAIALGGLALIASRQGRVDETFAFAERAEREAALAGMHPPIAAMQRARAEVLASTWKLPEAAWIFRDVARQSPRDDAAWVATAVAFGGASEPENALLAAQSGLLLQPRDGDLLRVQALAVPSPDAEAAFLERRTPDDAPSIRGKCSANVPGCANERIPVHVHVMRQAAR